jgi:tRNA(adenine34) deaminase
MRNDEQYIRKCIQLAERSLDRGEKPFGSLIVDPTGKIVVSSMDGTVKRNDVTAHAEILVMRKAQKRRGDDLTGYSIYSNYEPCAMCSYMIRELKFSRVVFSLISKDMGGYTKWPILQYKGL